MNRLMIVLKMIKIEHSIFALPFAFVGMLLATNGWPMGMKIFWTILAMVAARSMAMAYNRLVDWKVDKKNPRTKSRAIPAGLISLVFVGFFIIVSMALFVFSAYMLGPLCLQYSPIAIVILLGYSHIKHISWLCHLVLGTALGGAPVGAYIAVSGSLENAPWWLMAAVMSWVAGFDIFYSLQDMEFDNDEGLHSIPVRFGIKGALIFARLLHFLTVILLLLTGIQFDLGMAYFAGVVISAIMLVYEHTLVKEDDLSKINQAFFTINGLMGFVYLGGVILDLMGG